MKFTALGLLSVVLLPGADAAVTVYNDRDNYLAALGNANIVEATTTRTSPNFWAENIRIQYRDFEQCGLSFKWGGETNHMNFIQTRFGDHTGNRNAMGDQCFGGNAVWFLWLKDTPHNGTTVATEYPFYAMGFDFAGGGSPQFGIKIFGEDVQYFNMPAIHTGAPAQFLGLISDGEPVSEFEIVALPGRTNIHAMAFTNVAYATPDDDAITSVGCYNKNPASRSCWATGWGDPHLITWDGLRYDVHAKGEVIMARSMDSDFEIQARLEGMSGSTTSGPAVTTGVVVRDPGFPTLQVNIADANSATAQDFIGCPIDLFVDGTPTDVTSWEGVQGARVIVNEGAEKIVIEYVESNVRIDMRLKNYNGKCLFSVDYFLADCYNDEKLIGLLGSPDGNWSNDWMTQDDTVLPLPEGVSAFFFKDAYDYSVDNWCTRSPSESFFSYASGENFYTYANCGNAYDPSMEDILTNIPPELEFCNGDIGCLIDGNSAGPEAGQNFLDEPALDRTKEPSPAPTPPPTPVPVPTSGPTSGPTGGPTTTLLLELTENQNTFDDISDAADGGPIFGDTFNSRDPAGSNGDPHFKTWRNEHYEFHGQCDMVLVRDEDFANGLGLEVQIRTKMVRFWSYIHTAAIRIGDDILELQGSPDLSDRVMHYWFNFQYQAKDTTSIGGFPLKITNNGVHKRFFEIDLSSKFPGQKIVLKSYREFLNIQFEGTTEAAFGNTVGMLGNYKTGETFARDGVTVLHDFIELGNEWQVLPSDHMLFHDIADPQFPKRCIVPEDPRGERRRRLEESSISVESAEAACQKALTSPLDIKDCVYDILATQDLDMVGAF